MKRFFLLGWLCVASQFVNAQQTSPLDTRLIISGAFGEPRDNHFHTGVDFTTRGRTGIKIFAFNDGYVSRIKVSSVGYGKALYITHPDGTMTVYGHMSKFNDAIQQYVTDEQYKSKKFEQELYPSAEKFRVKKGDVIGYSGNSGGSSAPHLHFEVRDASGESFPLNPLKYDLAIKDTIPPVLRSLVVYDRSGLVEKELDEYVLTKRGNVYSTDSDGLVDTIKVNTPIVALGLRAEDLANFCDADGDFGIYSLELKMDGEQVFRFSMDRLDFAEGRCANAHIDYNLRKSERKRVYRAYQLPGNNASVYTRSLPDLQLKDFKPHAIELVAKDFYGNEARYNCFIKNISGKTSIEKNDNADKNYVVHYKPFNASSDNFLFESEVGTFYDNFMFDWYKAASRGNNITSTYDVGDTFIPVHKSFSLSLKPEVEIKESLRSKCVIMRGSSSYTTEWNNGWLVAKPKEFGAFRAVIDTLAPKLSPNNFKNNGAAPTNPKFTITDAASGVKDYDIYIDGTWVLTEYDAKNDLLTVIPKQKPASGVHELKAVVADKVGNKKTYTYKLTF